MRPNGLLLINVCLHGRADRTADKIAAGFIARDWSVKVFDEPGGARNAIVAVGAVKRLRKPGVSAPPLVGRDELKKNLRAMRFRKIKG